MFEVGFNTDPVGDITTDFLRQQWPISVFLFPWWIRDRSGTKSRPPALDNTGLCDLGPQEAQDWKIGG